jgi:hypothetical protein
MAQYFSVARRQITGILCVFQDLTTKLHAKTTSQIVQVISEKFLRQEEYRLNNIRRFFDVGCAAVRSIFLFCAVANCCTQIVNEGAAIFKRFLVRTTTSSGGLKIALKGLHT